MSGYLGKSSAAGIDRSMADICCQNTKKWVGEIFRLRRRAYQVYYIAQTAQLRLVLFIQNEICICCIVP